MNQEKSTDPRGAAADALNRRHAQRRKLDVVIGEGSDDERRREDRRKSKPGWQKLIEVVFGRG